MASGKTSQNTTATPSGAGPYFTIPEVAKMLGVSERWLADQCRDENIAHVYIARKRRFTSAQVEDLVRQHTKTPITIKAVDVERQRVERLLQRRQP